MTDSLETQYIAVHVMQDRDVTITQAETLSFKAKGSARRDPADGPNPAIGYNLATARALASLSAQYHKKAQSLMNAADNDRRNRAKAKAWRADLAKFRRLSSVAAGTGTESPIVSASPLYFSTGDWSPPSAPAVGGAGGASAGVETAMAYAEDTYGTAPRGSSTNPIQIPLGSALNPITDRIVTYVKLRDGRVITVYDNGHTSINPS